MLSPPTVSAELASGVKEKAQQLTKERSFKGKSSAQETK